AGWCSGSARERTCPRRPSSAARADRPEARPSPPAPLSHRGERGSQSFFLPLSPSWERGQGGEGRRSGGDDFVEGLLQLLLDAPDRRLTEAGQLADLADGDVAAEQGEDDPFAVVQAPGDGVAEVVEEHVGEGVGGGRVVLAVVLRIDRGASTRLVSHAAA